MNGNIDESSENTWKVLWSKHGYGAKHEFSKELTRLQRLSCLSFYRTTPISRHTNLESYLPSPVTSTCQIPYPSKRWVQSAAALSAQLPEPMYKMWLSHKGDLHVNVHAQIRGCNLPPVSLWCCLLDCSLCLHSFYFHLLWIMSVFIWFLIFIHYLSGDSVDLYSFPYRPLLIVSIFKFFSSTIYCIYGILLRYIYGHLPSRRFFFLTYHRPTKSTSMLL